MGNHVSVITFRGESLTLTDPAERAAFHDMPHKNTGQSQANDPVQPLGVTAQYVAVEIVETVAARHQQAERDGDHHARNTVSLYPPAVQHVTVQHRAEQIQAAHGRSSMQFHCPRFERTGQRIVGTPVMRKQPNQAAQHQYREEAIQREARHAYQPQSWRGPIVRRMYFHWSLTIHAEAGPELEARKYHARFILGQ